MQGSHNVTHFNVLIPLPDTVLSKCLLLLLMAERFQGTIQVTLNLMEIFSKTWK